MKKIISFLMVFVLLALQFPTLSVNAESSGNAWDGSIASSYGGGTGSSEDPFLIANSGQLARMAQEINNNNESNLYYKLTGNINLASRSWVPIGNANFPFKGNFDGNGYSISNMKVGYIQSLSRSSRSASQVPDNASPSQDVEVLYNPEIEALDQEMASINTELESAIAVEAEIQGEAAAQEEVAEADAEPEEGAETFGEEGSTNEDNADIRSTVDATIASVESGIADQNEAPRSFSLFSTQDSGYVGDAGLFGTFDSGVIEKVTVRESEITGRGNTGGIVGYSGVNATINQCNFDGRVDNASVGYIGGIVGYAQGLVSNCMNEGIIGSATPGSAFIGGIAGLSKNHINNSRNSGDILGNQSFIGGIAGKLDGSKMIMYCFNDGNIGSSDTAGNFAGGIVGRAPNGYVNKSANHGKVTSNSNDSNCFIGGLAGDVYIITTAYNTGDVSGYWASGLGGVITGGSLKNYNAGQISGARNASIVCLLESMGTVGRNSTFWRSGSASVAVRADAAYPYGGTPVMVSMAAMQGPNWVAGTLGSPFIDDDYLRNNRYPVIEGIEYLITLPQSPAGFPEGTFNYGGNRGKDSQSPKDDYQAKYHYNDSYFEQRASLYNPSLATMSMCLVLSGFNSNSDATKIGTDENSIYREKYKNAEQLLEDIGFTEIEANDDYRRKPTKNSFGVITGYKEITVGGKQKTLIALIGRGGGYGVEWSGNFEVGATGEHQGFTVGRDKAYNWLSSYINTHRDDASFHDEDVMFWMAGYSRAAAVTNLLAGKMTTDLSIAGVEYSNEDLYAYCLAPPMGALANESEAENRTYTNIHNVTNPNDPVPKVAPAAWSFDRYGVDERVIPDRLTTSNGAIFTKMYGKLYGLNTDWADELLGLNPEEREQAELTDYKLNEFQGKKLSIGPVENPGASDVTGENYVIKNSDIAMSQSLDQAMNLIAANIGSRQVYVTDFQASISEWGGRFLGNPEESELWKKTIPQHLKTAVEGKLPDIVLILLDPALTTEIKLTRASNLVINTAHETLTQAGITISKAVITDAYGLVLKTFFSDLLSTGSSNLMTVISNGNLLILPHYPELYFAWLQTHDPNYGGNSETYINTYRIASVNGDADVSVYDTDGTLVAQITDDVPVEIADSTIIASVETGHEKNIYLPADATYDIEIVAKGEGDVNYAVREYSNDISSYTKMVNYYDIPVASGDRLEGALPEFSGEDAQNLQDGSSVSYALDTSSSTLTPSLEVKGEAARTALYDVNIISNIENKGLAFGTGTYCEGSTVQIVAMPFEGRRFMGWYQGNERVSTDVRYEFMVTQDVNLTAVFE